MLKELIKGPVWAWSWLALMLAAVTAGFYFDVEGARNLALFILWAYGVTLSVITAIFVLIMLISDDGEEFWKGWKEEQSQRTFHIPIWIEFPVDFVILLIIVWAGHFVLGAFWLIALIGTHVNRHYAEYFLFEKLKEGFEDESK